MLVLVELDVPLDEMEITHAMKGGFDTSLESRLTGELVKVKSGPYENLATGTIIRFYPAVSGENVNASACNR